jgi:hypothetical protein
MSDTTMMITAREILIEALDRQGLPHGAELLRITDDNQLSQIGPVLRAALAAVERALIEGQLRATIP